MFKNLIGQDMTQEIQKDIDGLHKFSLFLKEIDVANLSQVCSDLPDDEYLDEATQIWAMYKSYQDEPVSSMLMVIENVFNEAFAPMSYPVPTDKIVAYLIENKGV